MLDVFSMTQVKQIRERMFNSAGFKLTETELKDYIKTMTTLLRDPTLLRTNAGAMQAVVKLQQVHIVEIFCNKNNRQVNSVTTISWCTYTLNFLKI